MSAWRALLIFPVRPGDAIRGLAGAPAAWCAPLVPAVLLTGYLVARSCAVADAAAAGGALLILVLGLAAGGSIGSLPARFVLVTGFRARGVIEACLVLAAWTPVLFVLALALARLLGADAAAALFAAFGVLIWGVATGFHVVAEEVEEPGRGLVASCAGLAGTLLGLWGALVLVQAFLVLAVPAPIRAGAIEPGDVLLVRRDAHPPPGSLVLLRDPASREALFAEMAADGGRRPVGAEPSPRFATWEQAGRVFFRCAGPWGGTAVSFEGD